ncbi:MAG: 4-hydroxythreonine-4-phosphate dehydrogenase PdxA [Deltaproteobacteria bacterium]|nr:4-hydroxythreonine-4-phosphate dehydrogenase PdxA [Deltaproteobacteria bacterium]
MKPTIAITMGDPTGVGPEIIVKAVNDAGLKRLCAPVVIGDRGVLAHIAARFKMPLPAQIKNMSALDLKSLKPGRPAAESSRAMIGYIKEAVSMAVKGEAGAIVTAPIGKEAAKKAGFKFPGHTEFIAHLTGTKDFAMMLGGRDLKVILVTIHERLRDVPGLVTEKAVLKTIRITDGSFRRYFCFKKPRIAVAGLNPHAGEGGIFALKLLHFEDGINVTLGLPIIRTSVDHGTAYDIAWKGVASPSSLIAAIKTAAGMARRDRKEK